MGLFLFFPLSPSSSSSFLLKNIEERLRGLHDGSSSRGA
jgi:hypothetical protein